jgi:hypothetical protein
MAGYHLTDIPRGKLGELSKVVEEVQEAVDADQQGNKIMLLLELSDVVGAIRLYLAKHHPGLTLRDLEVMADATERAFQSGSRPSSD